MDTFNKENYKVCSIEMIDKSIPIDENCKDAWQVIDETDNKITVLKNDLTQYLVLNKKHVLRVLYIKKESN